MAVRHISPNSARQPAILGENAAKSPKYRPFEPPKGFGWGFNADKGTLTFYSPTRVRTYRAESPACWYKSADFHTWRGSFGEEDFQIRDLTSAAGRVSAHLRQCVAAGQRVRSPGLASMAEFLDRLDPECVQLTEPLASDSWLLYGLLRRVPAIRDIARDNLALAMLVAQQRRVRRAPFRSVIKLGKLRRHHLLGSLDMPVGKPWVRVLSRYRHEDVSANAMHRFRKFAQRQPDDVAILRHLPVVHTDVLGLLHHNVRNHVAPSLLHEVATSNQHPTRTVPYLRGHVSGLLDDTVRMCRSLRRPVPLMRSIAQVGQVHDEVAEEARLATRSQYPFPSPPLPGTERILPLRNPADLHQEGTEQRNCLSAEFWADDCYGGHTYIYRIVAPERASVAIELHDDGVWRVRELKARYNSEVMGKTRKMIDGWLKGHGQSGECGADPLADGGIPF